MKNLKVMAAFFLMAMSFMAYGQKTSGTQPTTAETKIIAVVNRASWCIVCKANGERFGNNIMPYTSQGLVIVINDISDETAIAKSKADLKKSNLYKQIYKTKRKNVGRMMQACGIVDGKNKSIASGIITFIDAKTFKVLMETNIAITDAEMKTIINNLLKS